MQFLEKIKITSKVILVLIFLSLVSIGTLLYGARQMQSIGSTYQHLIDGDAGAVRDLAMGNQQLAEIGRLLYRMLSEEDSNEIKKAQQRLEPAKAEFLSRIHRAADAAPDFKAQMLKVAGDFEGNLDKIKEVEALSWQGETVKAQAVMSFKINPAMEEEMAEGAKIAGQLDADMRRAGAEAGRQTGLTILATLTLGAVGVVASLLLAAFLIRNAVSRPLADLGRHMGELARANLTVGISGQQRGDEIGEMARSVQVFKDAMIEAERLRRLQDEAQARKDAQQRQLLTMVDQFEQSSGIMVENARGAAEDLKKTAGTVGDLMTESTRRTGLVDQAGRLANEHVSTVAAATEQLSASIQEIGRLVRQSAAASGDAMQKANSSSDVIKGLAFATDKISGVVQLITDIAAQTNLLALNATIEAARAGEAGKGFAVVAGEVKNLATATARATGEITVQIKDVQTESQVAVEAIDGVVAIIRSINEMAAAVSAAVEEQGAATGEIAKSVQEAAGSTAEVADNVSSLLDIAHKTGQSAKELVVSANIMAGLSTELDGKRREFGDFIRNRQG